jgi:hypothetical protein
MAANPGHGVDQVVRNEDRESGHALKVRNQNQIGVHSACKHVEEEKDLFGAMLLKNGHFGAESPPAILRSPTHKINQAVLQWWGFSESILNGNK